MRLAKTESLKKDIEIISQNHERDVDRKDAILQMMDRDLEEAEDQYQVLIEGIHCFFWQESSLYFKVNCELFFYFYFSHTYTHIHTHTNLTDPI